MSKCPKCKGHLYSMYWREKLNWKSTKGYLYCPNCEIIVQNKLQVVAKSVQTLGKEEDGE